MRVVRTSLVPLVLAVATLAGCLGTDMAPTGPGEAQAEPLCPDPCERAVDTSDRRAFEPTAALDPRDAANAVVVSTLFRDSDDLGHPMDLYLHRTTDRGATWETRRFWDVLPLDHPVKPYNMWADPMVRWLNDGTVVLFGMGGTGANPPDGPVPVLGFTGFDVWVARSHDGGATWPDGGVVFEGSGVTSFASTPSEIGDQPHLAVGPDGSLLLAFVRTTSTPQGNAQDILATRSADQGATWSEPVVVADGTRVHNPRPAILADGTMFVAYRDWQDDWTTGPVLVARSDDGGASWVDVATFEAHARPSLAASGDALHLALAHPSSAGEHLAVVLHTSTDRGASWTTRGLDTAQRDDHLILNAAGTPDGRLYVTWNRPVPGDLNEFWAHRIASDGAATTARLDTTPLGRNDLVGPEELAWSSLGDYFGLAATADGALSAWVSGDRSGQDVRAAWLT